MTAASKVSGLNFYALIVNVNPTPDPRNELGLSMIKNEEFLSILFYPS